MTNTQQAKARLLHELHHSGEPLVLTNVWDAAGARLVARAGAPAVATASAAVSWTLGARDGEGADLTEVLAQTALVARSVDLPVTADLESGFADTAAGVGATIAGLLATGAVGVNLEDGRHGGGGALWSTAEAAERIAAARAVADEAGVDLFINARTDLFLRGVGDPAGRVEAAIARLNAYVEAGADGVFVPGVADRESIAKLVGGVPAPLNVLAGPGFPSVPELAELGVARVSLGPGLALLAFGTLRFAAEAVYGSGTYTALAGGLGYGEMNALAR
ncbi:isocitrate lyase/PEP mutase family protein [Kitasatospora sp. NPDC004240]